MNNPSLTAFMAVAETGTVHAAAARLGLSQTAVTQRLKGLERELALTLFLRSRRGMSLTSEGGALLQYCRAAGELEGAFLSRVKGKSREEWSLTLVGPTSAISTRVAENCAPLYGRHPHLRLHLHSDDSDHRLQLVRRGAADLAIVSPELVPNEMDSKMLKPDRYLLVASPKWRGRRLAEILERERIVDFDEEDRTTRNYLKAFGLLGSAKRERLYVNENEALIRLFAAGVGFGTLTESVARTHLEAGRLITLNRGQAMEDPLALVWYPRVHKSEAFADVVRVIQ